MIPVHTNVELFWSYRHQWTQNGKCEHYSVAWAGDAEILHFGENKRKSILGGQWGYSNPNRAVLRTQRIFQVSLTLAISTSTQSHQIFAFCFASARHPLNVDPPSISIAFPVTCAAPKLDKYSTNPAKSSGLPTLPLG
jgi:hypothetical protein